MQLRRKTINDIKGKPQQQKAVAIALFIKAKVGRDSTIHNYTINKIRKITGMSAATIRKFMPIMKRMGLIHFSGKNNEHLIISRLASDIKKRNICVDKFCFNSYKDVYNSLRAFIALIVQSHKDFVKRTLQIAHNPQHGEDCKGARKLVKRLVKQGILKSVYDEYKEYGLSYERIARETGNCVRTAQNIINYAIKKKWATKKHNFEKIFAKNVYYRKVEGYTFSTKHNIYLIHANTYQLSASVAADISHGNISW